MNEEEVFNALSKLCEINKTIEFDVCIPILNSGVEAKIFIGQ